MSNFKTVKLSSETLNVLKIASTINKSLAFKAGNEVKTVSTNGAIVLEATVPETFPVDFAVYELNKLLTVLSLPAFKEAELLFEDGVTSHMLIKSGASKVKYFFSPTDFVVHPGKSIVLPKVDVEFMLPQDVMDNFHKAAAALGHKIIKFKVDNKKLYLIATPAEEIDTSNDYIVDMGDIEADDFEAKIKLENLKLVDGDYTVALLKMGGKGISKFSHLTRKIVSFIGLEMQ